MTLIEIKNRLEETGLPVAYRTFPKDVEAVLPFIVYYSTGARNFSADNSNYFGIDGIIVELYTADKEVEIEKELEAKLDFAIWDKNETYIDSNKCYLITYTMEV